MKVKNGETNTNYTWDAEKALGRYYFLKDQLMEEDIDFGKFAKNNEKDAFWDPPDPNLLGTA